MVRTIEQAISDMRQKSKVPVETVINETGMPESTIYRKCSLTDPEVQFKITEIIPMMRAFRRYDPLEVIARACGFLIIRPPAGKAKLDACAQDFHKEFSELFVLLLDFLNEPTREKIRALDVACKQHMQNTANIQAGARKSASQMGIEFGDGE
ncbi:hypothetical protein JW777_00790 [bacterium]|nr:hypothetical protein [bacterium]